MIRNMMINDMNIKSISTHPNPLIVRGFTNLSASEAAIALVSFVRG